MNVRLFCTDIIFRLTQLQLPSFLSLQGLQIFLRCDTEKISCLCKIYIPLDSLLRYHQKPNAELFPRTVLHKENIEEKSRQRLVRKEFWPLQKQWRFLKLHFDVKLNGR